MIEGDDAARLLRHELKRQGLNELAGNDIKLLKVKALNLAHHPLAIRWFAWSCKKDRSLWDRKTELVDLKQIEDFCVSSTLVSLGFEAQKVLGAILAIDNPSEATADCIAHAAEIEDDEIDPILWDLECSGLLNVVTDENGITTYSVAPMAQRLAKEAARVKGWETGYVTALRRYNSKRGPTVTSSPLIRDLLGIRPAEIRHLSKQEKEEVVKRVDRALPSALAADRARLLWRKAECARHLSQAVTADEVYMQAAEEALRLDPPLHIEEMWHLLLEAATVAKARSTGTSYTERAVRYLTHVLKFDAENTRVVGMLAELYGILGDEEEYLKFDAAGRRLLEVEDPDGIYAGNLRFALDRARENYVWSARTRRS